MEFTDPLQGTAIWCEHADEEEDLSLCDLPLYNDNGEQESSLRDSNGGCSNHNDDFNFEFGRSNSMEYQACPADDLFRQGRLLPLALQRCRSESNADFSYGRPNCCSENRRLLNEKLQAWRIDSLDSQDLQRKNCSSESDKKLPSGNSSTTFSKSKCKPNLPPLGTKISPKWHKFFTLGLIKTPTMKLEDMRLRQGNRCNKSKETPILKRSLSYNHDEGSKLGKTEHRGVVFRPKSKSLVDKTEKAGRSKRWRMLSPLTSSNGCKAATNSVVNCTSSTKKM